MRGSCTLRFMDQKYFCAGMLYTRRQRKQLWYVHDCIYMPPSWCFKPDRLNPPTLAWQFGEKADAVLSSLELLMELHLNASEEEVNKRTPSTPPSLRTPSSAVLSTARAAAPFTCCRGNQQHAGGVANNIFSFCCQLDCSLQSRNTHHAYVSRDVPPPRPHLNVFLLAFSFSPWAAAAAAASPGFLSWSRTSRGSHRRTTWTSPVGRPRRRCRRSAAWLTLSRWRQGEAKSEHSSSGRAAMLAAIVVLQWG